MEISEAINVLAEMRIALRGYQRGAQTDAETKSRMGWHTAAITATNRAARIGRQLKALDLAGAALTENSARIENEKAKSEKVQTAKPQQRSGGRTARLLTDKRAG